MDAPVPKTDYIYKYDVLEELYNLHCVPVITKRIIQLAQALDLEQELYHTFSNQAASILEKRYLLKDSNGEVFEYPDLMLVRVAVGVTSTQDDWMDSAIEYYNSMRALEFLPNSPTLMNAGTKLGQLAACFVVPVDDSMDGIFDGVKNVALIHKSGGGTGMDFSSLRQNGSYVKSTGGVASGPVSFMKIYDTATEQVKQGGSRRGANMGMLRVDHPDIIEFITCKDNGVDFQNFNLSVAITNEFMRALKGENPSDLDGADESTPYLFHMRNPKNGVSLGLKDAREIWSLIVDHAHDKGDPGIVFIDRVNEEGPFDINEYPYHEMVATNPCGEQPLEAYESCNLGSLNLNRFTVLEDDYLLVDWDKLREAIFTAVCFLDDVIDANIYPLPEIHDKVHQNRKIGLGVMGLADILAAKHVVYGSDKSYSEVAQIMSFINKWASVASRELGEIRGSFPAIDESIYAEVDRRNATVTTIAPTGTLSMLAEASSGIEPLFALAYEKNVMDESRFVYVTDALNEVLHTLSEEERNYTIDNGYLPPKKLSENPWLVTAHDIDPIDHVKMQAVVQMYTDNAVSKTVNLPEDATKEDISEVYMKAFEEQCKGVTVYRDGSRDAQVLTTGTKEPEPVSRDEIKEIFGELEKAYPATMGIAPPDDGEVNIRPFNEYEMHLHETRDRPETLIGYTSRIDTPCGNLYVTMNTDDQGRLFEVFCKLGKSGACAGAVQETLGRLISQDLRAGGDVSRIIKQLRGASCGQSIGMGPNKVSSCIDAIGKVLEKYQSGELIDRVEEDGDSSEETPLDKPIDLPEQSKDVKPARRRMNGACPDCGASTEHAEGCTVCRACGWSKCA